jgi:1-acyl-sn-glycerol-3-phosphate acyltransferase
MGIFIEGGIPDPGDAPTPKDGVAMLALRTGAPVIPVYIGGMINKPGIIGAVFSRHRARVWYGKPVDLSEFAAREDHRQAAREATKVIYDAILALGERDRQFLEGGA